MALWLPMIRFPKGYNFSLGLLIRRLTRQMPKARHSNGIRLTFGAASNPRRVEPERVVPALALPHGLFTSAYLNNFTHGEAQWPKAAPKSFAEIRIAVGL